MEQFSRQISDLIILRIAASNILKIGNGLIEMSQGIQAISQLLVHKRKVFASAGCQFDIAEVMWVLHRGE